MATAVDEYAWTVNNVLEWYAMYFSPEVIAVQDDMLWGPDNQENLYWGTNIGFAKAEWTPPPAAFLPAMTRWMETFPRRLPSIKPPFRRSFRSSGTWGPEKSAAMTELAQLLG